jgi:CHAT domain-containing protein/Tfp pilus assembly protein PilF
LVYLFVPFFVFNSISLNAQTRDEDLKNAVELFKSANVDKTQYKLSEAETKYRKATELFKKYESFQNEVYCSVSLAEVLLNKNEFDEALQIYADAEKLTSEKLGEKNKILITIYYGLGNGSFYKGRNETALNYYKKAISLNKELNKEENIFSANLLSSVGNIFNEEGKLDSALTYYQNDFNLRKKLSGDSDPDIARSIINIVGIYQQMCKYDKALEFLQIALNIILKTNGENSSEAALIYSKFGSIYLDKHQPDLALGYSKKALEIDNRIFGESNINTANEYVNLGNIYKALGNDEESLAALKKALEIQINLLGEKHPDLAKTYGNIGTVLSEQGKNETALTYYQKAIEIKTAYFGENNPELAAYYNNIGLYYNLKSDFRNAMLNFKKAGNIIIKNYGEKNPGLVKIYVNIGNAYFKTNDYENALRYFQKSLKANVKDFNPDSTDLISNPKLSQEYFDINKLFISLREKARIFDAVFIKSKLKSDAKISYNTYLLCDSLVNKARMSVNSNTDKIALGNETKKLYENSIRLTLKLSDLETNTSEKQKLEDKAFYFSERNKSGILSEAISSANAVQYAGIPQNLIDLENSYNSQIADFEKKIAETNDENAEKSLRDSLFSYNSKLRNLTKKFENDFPKYFELKYKEPSVSVRDIQNSLKDSTALRSYFLGDSVLIIFTIDKNCLKVFQYPIKKDFDEKIKDFRTKITSAYKNDILQYTKSAYDFYKILFPDTLENSVKTLIIIPDGILGIIPFEALFPEPYNDDISAYKDYPFLINKYDFSYFSSAGLYMHSINAELKHNPGRMDWIGIAPIFDKEKVRIFNDAYLAPLPGTEDEVNKIMKLFTDKQLMSDVKLRETATEAYVKSNDLVNYKYIHIATHGMVNPDKPELSGLLLTTSETDANDGILYSGEIYNLKLDADLVVLSACETGLGKISKSQGVIGLSQALLYAGAYNLIVSLWNVSDASTSQLMVYFYSIFLNSNQRDFTKALNSAKRKLIKEGKYAHPFFWSPFILIGK